MRLYIMDVRTWSAPELLEPVAFSFEECMLPPCGRMGKRLRNTLHVYVDTPV